MSSDGAERAQRTAMLHSLRERLERGDSTLQHGSRMLHNAGCRCDPCAEAERRYVAEQHPDAKRRHISRLRERVERGDPTVPHGSATTYESGGCRCDECVEAASAKRIRIARRQGITARTWTDEQILQTLRSVGPMRSAQYRAWRSAQTDRAALPSHSLVLKRFGGWDAAQRAAFPNDASD